jgi:hypothetical protein
MAAAAAASAGHQQQRPRRRRRQGGRRAALAAAAAATAAALLALPAATYAQTVRPARRPGTPAACATYIPPGGQCGGNGGDCARYGACGGALGPWTGRGFCCTPGFTCQAGDASSGDGFQVWRCLEGALDGAPTEGDRQALPWPPRALPEFACTARVDSNGRRVPGRCPSPWTTAPQGFSQVPGPLRVEAEPGQGARLVTAGRAGGARRPALLRGFNNFGWNVGDNNVGGLGWAYCDDNAPGQSPPCKPGDADIPPWWDKADPEIFAARGALNASFWGRRTLTNDFSTVVWRQRLLGFNAVRIPFAFDALAADLPPADKAEFALCQRDDPADIAVGRTLDPSLRPTVLAAAQELDAQLPGAPPDGLPPPFPPYLGMPHPPPIDALTSGGPAESVQASKLPWQAPLRWQAPPAPGRPAGTPNGTSVLRLTQCNYYLPAEGQALHRLLWQVQHYVASGFYVVLSFHPVQKTDANFRRPALLESNWRALWRSLVALPEWRQHMAGRVFPDLINEPGIAGCEWGAPAKDARTGEVTCAPAVELFAKATAAIREAEPGQIIFLNGLGQPAGGGGAWGDGFLTNRAALAGNATDASAFFAPAAGGGSQGAPPNFVLAPHTYGGSITGWGLEFQGRQALWKRFEASFARKASGGDVDASGKQLPAVFPWLLGEFGARDDGAALDLAAPASGDSTAWSGPDLAFLRDVADFLRREGGTAADKARLRVARASRERPGWLRVRQGGVAWGDGVPPPTPPPVPGQPGMMQVAWRDPSSQGAPTIADIGATGGYSEERAPWAYWISGSRQPGSSLIWAWNANAQDTRGIVGGAATHKAVQWRKVQFLAAEFGLRPWYCEVLEASARPLRRC